MSTYSAKLLLVDDAVPTLAVLAKTLSHIGYKNLRACENGSTAMEELELAHNKGEPFDMVLCDWHMPNMTGLELVKEMRSSENHSNVLFIMITADTNIDKIVEAVKAGADGYIFKPVTAEQAAKKIEAVLQERDEKSQ